MTILTPSTAPALAQVIQSSFSASQACQGSSDQSNSRIQEPSHQDQFLLMNPESQQLPLPVKSSNTPAATPAIPEPLIINDIASSDNAGKFPGPPLVWPRKRRVEDVLGNSALADVTSTYWSNLLWLKR
jgi:hypothetical protein